MDSLQPQQGSQSRGWKQKTGKLVAAPIRCLGSMCCFNAHVAEDLERERAALQSRMDESRSNGEIIFPKVEAWLKGANHMRIQADGVQKGENSCLEFESPRQMEEEIMTLLRGNNINTIGICGTAGVGKTATARRIINRAMEEGLFDDIVTVHVTQHMEMWKIQLEIAEWIGLRWDVQSFLCRAIRLHVRLMGRRTLIVLDDVWKPLKLPNLGVTVEGCKIIVTSPSRDVVDSMLVQKVFEMPVLCEAEAWFLLKQKARHPVHGLDLSNVVKQVARECKDLKIALVTADKELKGPKTKSLWDDGLLQLTSANPEKVYPPLKLSYDFLVNCGFRVSRSAKTLFSLCSLFPEDDDIPLKLLTSYCVGLHLLEGVSCMEEARNTTYMLVQILKRHSLLLDGRDQHHVKMHDVVRDAAIFLASKEGRMDCSGNLSTEHSWTSLNMGKSIGFPVGLNYPRLRLLLINDDRSVYHHNSAEYQGLDDFSFQGMEELTVLSLRSLLCKLLPHSAQLLKNLRTLHLQDCEFENISAVGELANLEVLTCFSCAKIKELPLEIGNLNRLKLLEILYCRELKTIVAGVISKLVELEELHIIGSFEGWEAGEEGKERKNAALCELECLSKLTVLKIEIEDSTAAAKEMCLSSKIMKYDITVSGIRFTDNSKNRCMTLKLPYEFTPGNWIHKLVRSTECLYLSGGGANRLDLAKARDMKSLYLTDCWTIKTLAKTTSRRFYVFPLLESLNLVRLPNLEEIRHGIIRKESNSFGNLKDVLLVDLRWLKHIWKIPSGFLRLEKLEIEHCPMMEEVFWSCYGNKEDGESPVVFPRLKKLRLIGLESLTNFCKGIENIEFPQLTEMEISGCPMLIRHEDDSLNLFCKPKDST